MAYVATKAAAAFQASASNSAGGTTTGTAVDLTTALGCTVQGKITNGGTGPTLGCRMRVQVSNDSSTWYDFSSETAGTTLGTTYMMQPVVLPPETMYARTVFDGNTGQAVTVQADAAKLTNVG